LSRWSIVLLDIIIDGSEKGAILIWRVCELFEQTCHNLVCRLHLNIREIKVDVNRYRARIFKVFDSSGPTVRTQHLEAYIKCDFPAPASEININIWEDKYPFLSQ